MMLDATQKFDEPLTDGAAVRLACGAVSDRAQRHEQDHRRRLARRQIRPDAGRLGSASAASSVHYEAPAAERLDSEMKAFLDWFNGEDDTDPVLKAGARASVVRDHPSVRRRQRPHRARHRRHVAGALGRQPAALLQHVGANPAGAQGLLRHAGSNAEGRSRHHALAGMVSGLPRPRLRRRREDPAPLFSGRRTSGRSMPRSPLNRRQRDMLNRLLDGFEGKLTSSKWAATRKMLAGHRAARHRRSRRAQDSSERTTAAAAAPAIRLAIGPANSSMINQPL